MNSQLEQLKNKMLAHGITQDGKPLSGIMRKETNTLSPFTTDSMTNLNVLTPAIFTTFIDPETLSILFQALKAFEFGNERQAGAWKDNIWAKKLDEYAGTEEEYSDHSRGLTTAVNRNLPSREGYRFQFGLDYGQLEEALGAAQGFSIVTEKRKAIAELVNRTRNRIYHYGVAGKSNLFGLFNDPGLPTSLTTSNPWNTTGTFETILEDVKKLALDIIGKSGGLVSMADKFKLITSPRVLAAINFVDNELNTISIAQRIKNAFGNIEFADDPLLEKVSGTSDLVELQVEYAGRRPWELGHGEKFRLTRLIPDTTSDYQKAVSQIYGAWLIYPWQMSRMTGVGVDPAVKKTPAA